MLNKKRMARLNSIMRIIGKMDFQTPNQLDKSNWVYRYSHPYIRVLGAKEATKYMNEINSPVSVDPKVHPVYQKQKRFNVPTPISPTKKSHTKLTEALTENPLKNSDLIESESLNPHKENMMKSDEFDERDQDTPKDSVSPFFAEKNGSCGTPSKTGFKNLKRNGLQLPLEASVGNSQLNGIPSQFHSNSHFRVDGMVLDMAISPNLRECTGNDRDAINNSHSYNLSPSTMNNQRSTQKPGTKLLIELAENKISSENVVPKPNLGSQEFSSAKISSMKSNKSNNGDKRPTIVDIKKKQVGPLSMSKKGSPHTKSESRVNWTNNLAMKAYFEDEQQKNNESRDNLTEDRKQLGQNEIIAEKDFDSIAKEGTIILTKLKMPDVNLLGCQTRVHSEPAEDK